MLRNHHHLLELAVRAPLLRLNSRICLYPGIPSKFPWSSDVQTSKKNLLELFISTFKLQVDIYRLFDFFFGYDAVYDIVISCNIWV